MLPRTEERLSNEREEEADPFVRMSKDVNRKCILTCVFGRSSDGGYHPPAPADTRANRIGWLSKPGRKQQPHPCAVPLSSQIVQVRQGPIAPAMLVGHPKGS